MSIHEISIDIAGTPLRIETGRMANLAAGSVVVSLGETMVITGASTSKPREGIDFFPLTIDYREKTYSAGKIPGGFLKRESAPTPKEILTMRMTDRPIRPMWPEGFRDEVQVQTFVISFDQMNDPDILSVNGASAAIALSQMPFLGPIGAVRVGLVDGEFIAFPDNELRARSEMDFVVAGSKDAVTMVEAGANEISEETAIAALEFAHDVIKKICAGIEALREKAGWTAPSYEGPVKDTGPLEVVREKYLEAFRAAVHKPTKKVRNGARRAVMADAMAALVATDDAENAGLTKKQVGGAFHSLEKEIVREAALSGTRIDGRRTDEIRDITVEVGLLPRAHGSALFTRGETQALVTTTLGTGMDEKLVDGLHSQSFTRKYYLHYNFPPMSASVRCGRCADPTRREKSDMAPWRSGRSCGVLPPTATRCRSRCAIVSDDASMSNGSSSMASRSVAARSR